MVNESKRHYEVLVRLLAVLGAQQRELAYNSINRETYIFNFCRELPDNRHKNATLG